MIIKPMGLEDAPRIRDIDRSETIGNVYSCANGVLAETKSGHECPNWQEEEYNSMIARFEQELRMGGTAYGAYDGETLVGFGVLANTFRGKDRDQLQVDLMYVTRAYRRQGIGSRIMDALSEAAIAKGAKSLYISSTETESAVKFYASRGSALTAEVDEELFAKEPLDIHMIKRL
ncbi:GNAT family N-acetyltransferase [Paenibacillus methanolicus]|uniref:Acetyltransferase (GNAT) family protein n=1 Tax=Paenibacillus methanolicus TaxID=582686 RepID=A0A5S5C5W0_9BACL|nr:GNAT family N-acetyltransferase [Paenibacillus methanolicus]TYP74724.1 acetyltransferase (GNAT) family protein [Paenibacillus methanolicus]